MSQDERPRVEILVGHDWTEVYEDFEDSGDVGVTRVNTTICSSWRAGTGRFCSIPTP
jgi:hypothetical protein